MGPEAGRKRLSDTQKRLLLYGLPILAVALALLFISVMGQLAVLDEDQDWTQIDYAALPEVDTLRRYLRIDTSQDSGSEIAGAVIRSGTGEGTFGTDARARLAGDACVS